MLRLLTLSGWKRVHLSLKHQIHHHLHPHLHPHFHQIHHHLYPHLRCALFFSCVFSQPLKQCRTTLYGRHYLRLSNGTGAGPLLSHSNGTDGRVLVASSGYSHRAHITYPYLLALGGLFGFFKQEEEDGSEVPPSVKRQLLRASRALRQDDYPRAERAYHRALQLLSQSAHANSQTYLEARAVTLDKLANMYLEQGKLDKAEANFKETIRVMLSVGVSQEDAAVIGISLKLAKIYTNQREYELASAGFQWCVETAEKKWDDAQTDESLALWGMCLHGKGQCHLFFKEAWEASLAFSEALRVGEQVYGPDHIQVSVLHNDLATALDRVGKYLEAETHIKRSIEIASALEGQEVTEHLAAFYYNLGTVYSNQGDSSSAVQAYEMALKEAKKLKNKVLQDQIKSAMNA